MNTARQYLSLKINSKEEAPVNYWIFVTNEDDNAFAQILDSRIWGFENMPVRRLLPEIGDRAVFYLAGDGRGYFAGETRLSSTIDVPAERKGIGGPISASIDMDDIKRWPSAVQFKLREPRNREKLSMIRNKNKWGSIFQGSIKEITEQDYRQIKELVGECR